VLHGEAAEAVARHDAAAARSEALRRRDETLAAELAALPQPPSRERLAAAEGALAANEARLAEARAEIERSGARLRELAPAQEAAREAAIAAEREAVAGRERLAAAELRLREAMAVLARWTERRDAIERARARLNERSTALARRRELHADGDGGDPAACERELTAAESELTAADGALDLARDALAREEHARTETAARLRELRRAADALAAEIRVLEGLIPPGGADSLLDRLDVPEELGTALATAFGDELLAGTDPDAQRRWGACAAGLAPAALPDGAVPLATLIGAPEVLQARLARTGLVDVEDAARLQAALPVGHRLVSRDGGLWRWDGYVQIPGAETQTAAGIRHQLRLHAAREELAVLGEEVAAAEVAAEAAEAAVRSARAMLGDNDTRWRAADSAQLRARQRLQEALALAQRRAAEAVQLDEEEHTLRAEIAELEREADTLGDGESPASERTGADAATVAARSEVGALEGALKHALAEADRATKALAAAGDAQRGIEATAQRLTGEVERARTEVAALARSVVAEEADLRARADALERERVALVQAAQAAAAELAPAEELRSALIARRNAAEAECAAAEHARRCAADALAACREDTLRLGERSEAVLRAGTEMDVRLAEGRARAEELATRVARLEGESARAKADSRSDPAALEALERALAQAQGAAAAARGNLDQRETDARVWAGELATAEEALTSLRERLAVAQAERAHAHEALATSVAIVRERLQQEPLALLADDQMREAVATADPASLDERLTRLRAFRERLGAVNLRAEIEAGELETTVSESRSREAELQEAVGRLRAGIGTLDSEARERLLAAFEAVDGHFRRLFATLFGGGKAHLRLTGADDPLRAGLELEASPPGKKLSSISLLSGGEKTLTALALVFGFFLAQPSPLCVLDEVDAPLDDANVDRFVGLMHEIAQATGTRFLVVTHHPLTMARMHRLYGVTMAERGVSRLVSVALEQALELRATA
jgi:chromosome segregation protein